MLNVLHTNNPLLTKTTFARTLTGGNNAGAAFGSQLEPVQTVYNGIKVPFKTPKVKRFKNK